MHYKIKNTLIDLSENSLKINNQQIDCPEKISQAFALFLESNNQVVTKESLIGVLWGDLVVSDDSLFKVIQGLRKLAKENGLEGILTNVYGKGYKITQKIHKLDQAPEFNPGTVRSGAFLKNKKWIFLAVFSLIVLAMGSYYFMVNEPESKFDKKAYLALKEQIKADPKAFLASVDSQYNLAELNERSKTDIYSLKAFAHFSLGHYEELFDYGQKALDLAGDNKSLAVATVLHLFAKVFYYRADGEKSSFYIKKANKMYSDLNYLDGVYGSQYIILSLRHLEKQYEREFNDAKIVYQMALKDKHGKGQIIALLHMYFASSELNEKGGEQAYVLQALEIAVELNNRDVISTCYGVLAQDNLEKSQYIKAMNWTNKLLKYAVSQPDTNLFMQGFSYMYNILSPLGYDQLAEKYLQKGIDLQAHLNSEGHLHEAEINLAILKIKLGKYKQARQLLSQLTTYKLSVKNRVRVQAWIAINQVKMHDHISAYATAKETFNSKDSPERVRFIAGIAYVIAANELERQKESDTVFEQLKFIADDRWLIEYQMFLDMALALKSDDEQEVKILQKKQNSFTQKVNSIREQAQPNYSTLKELDAYLERVLAN